MTYNDAKQSIEDNVLNKTKDAPVLRSSLSQALTDVLDFAASDFNTKSALISISTSNVININLDGSYDHERYDIVMANQNPITFGFNINVQNGLRNGRKKLALSCFFNSNPKNTFWDYNAAKIVQFSGCPFVYKHVSLSAFGEADKQIIPSILANFGSGLMVSSSSRSLINIGTAAGNNAVGVVANAFRLLGSPSNYANYYSGSSLIPTQVVIEIDFSSYQSNLAAHNGSCVAAIKLISKVQIADT